MEYFKIGKLVAAFGVKGEMILKHSLGKKSALKGLKAIFIEEQKQSFIPWFIISAKSKSEELLKDAERVLNDAKTKSGTAVNTGKQVLESETNNLKNAFKAGVTAYKETKNS